MNWKHLTVGVVMVATALMFKAGASLGDEKAAEKDIVETAVEAGQFKTLVTAVKAAELVETLKGKGPFTVFAPTDEAFAKVPKDKLEALLKDKKALTAVLTYHVVPGKVMAADVVKLDCCQDRAGQVCQHRHQEREGHDQRSQCGKDRYCLRQRRDPRHRRGDSATPVECSPAWGDVGERPASPLSCLLTFEETTT